MSSHVESEISKLCLKEKCLCKWCCSSTEEPENKPSIHPSIACLLDQQALIVTDMVLMIGFYMAPAHQFPFKAVLRANFVFKKGIPNGFPKEPLFGYKEKLAKEQMRSSHGDCLWFS